MIPKHAQKPEAMLIFENPTNPKIMDQMPENLTKCSSSILDYEVGNNSVKPDLSDSCVQKSPLVSSAELDETSKESSTNPSTKIKLSFSVDRLLSDENKPNSGEESFEMKSSSCKSFSCCENPYACCSYLHCYLPSAQQQQDQIHQNPHLIGPTLASSSSSYSGSMSSTAECIGKLFPGAATSHANFVDYKSVVRPLPIRAMGNTSESVTLCTTAYPTLATTALLRFHQQQQKPSLSQLVPPTPHPSLTVMTPLNGLKSLQLTQQTRFLNKATHNMLEIPISTGTTNSGNGSTANGSGIGGSTTTNNTGGATNATSIGGKRKRSWSRAVFTNLQRKGLEIQFQQQKYITKPDRRKLAARLNLTDAQVKVWFQNRRMKWRHTRENLKSGQEKQPCITTSNGNGKLSTDTTERNDVGGYSSDGTSSADLSENEEGDDDGDEIDVVE